MNPSTNELIALLVARHFTEIPNAQRRADVLEVAAAYLPDESQRISMASTAKAIRETEKLQLNLPSILFHHRSTSGTPDPYTAS